jgi:hypothetical protein
MRGEQASAYHQTMRPGGAAVLLCVGVGGPKTSALLAEV